MQLSPVPAGVFGALRPIRPFSDEPLGRRLHRGSGRSSTDRASADATSPNDTSRHVTVRVVRAELRPDLVAPGIPAFVGQVVRTRYSAVVDEFVGIPRSTRQARLRSSSRSPTAVPSVSRAPPREPRGRIALKIPRHLPLKITARAQPTSDYGLPCTTLERVSARPSGGDVRPITVTIDR